MSEEIKEETFSDKLEEVVTDTFEDIKETIDKVEEVIEEAVQETEKVFNQAKDTVIRLGDKVRVAFCHDPNFIGVEGEIVYKGGLGNVTIKTANGAFHTNISGLEKK